MSLLSLVSLQLLLQLLSAARIPVVAEVPAAAGVPVVACVPVVAWVPAVAGVLSVADVSAIADIPAIAGILAAAGVCSAAGGTPAAARVRLVCCWHPFSCYCSSNVLIDRLVTFCFEKEKFKSEALVGTYTINVSESSVILIFSFSASLHLGHLRAVESAGR